MSDNGNCWCGSVKDPFSGKCSASNFHGPTKSKPETPVKVLYVSGPMSDYPDANYPAFYRAAAMLETAGYMVLNPAHVGDPGMGYAELIKKDLHLLLESDAVAVLEGWWASRGASVEVSVAGILEMPVRTVSDWIRLAQVDGPGRPASE